MMEWLLEILDSSYRPVISGLVGGAILYCIIIHFTKRKAKIVDGKNIVKAGKSMRLFIWLFFILTIFIILSAFNTRAGQGGSAFLIVVFCLVANYYLIKNILFTVITFDDETIHIKRMKYNEEFLWNEINFYKYSNFSNSYVLKVNNKNIYISGFLDGMDSFVEKLREVFENTKDNKFDIKKILNMAIGNKEQLKESNKCGCFSCITIFNYHDIYDFVKASDGSIRFSAICPNCSEVETTLGDASGIVITKDNLSYIKSHIIDV